MKRTILLDAGPLGLLCSPPGQKGDAATLVATNVIIATTNVGHLSRFFAADLWQNIRANP